MNWLDLGLIVLVSLSTMSGLIKGLVREVFSLGGVVLAILAALLLAPQVQPVFERWISYPTAAYAASLLVIFLLVMMASEFLARLLTKLIQFVQLGPVNRLFGGLFGIVRGGLIGIVLVLGLALFLDPGHETLVRSRVTPYLTWGARLLSGVLPDDIGASVELRLDELDAARERERHPSI